MQIRPRIRSLQAHRATSTEAAGCQPQVSLPAATFAGSQPPAGRSREPVVFRIANAPDGLAGLLQLRGR